MYNDINHSNRVPLNATHGIGQGILGASVHNPMNYVNILLDCLVWGLRFLMYKGQRKGL